MKTLAPFFALALVLALAPNVVSEQDDRINPANTLRDDAAVTRYLETPAGTPRYVTGVLADQVARGTEVEAAYRFFADHRAAYRMSDPRAELEVRRVETDDLGMRHVRMQQRYRGVRVVGGEMAVHFTPDDVLRTVSGSFRSGIEVEVTPQVGGSDAVVIAQDDLATFFGDGTPGEPELVIFPWEGGNYLAWRFFIFSDTPMGRWEYYVNAQDGSVIYRANRIMNTDAVGTGIGVMGAARNHIDADYTGSTYQMRDYTRRELNDPHGHDGHMPSTSYIQTNLATTTLPGTIATDADNYWDIEATQRPAVDGHVYTGLVYDYLNHQLGRNGYNDAGATMLTVVNYSAEGDDNAYWDGLRIVVWSWSTGWRSLAGCLDVIAHEWGHAVTEYSANLVYEKEPGALNESFSDMIGAAFEFYHDTLDVPDWYMGENGRLTGVGFRNMANPHEFGDPDTYGTTDPYWIDVVSCTPSYNNDYCGVHINSGVGNKWFYLLSDGGTHNNVSVTGIGVQNAMKIAYRANTTYWNSQTDYHEAAIGTMDAADDLDPTGVWGQSVAQAWTAVNVSVPVPGLVFSYPDGAATTVSPDAATAVRVVIGGVYGGTMQAGSGQVHYAIDGGAWMSEGLTVQSGDTFQASLPSVACGGSIAYYFSARLSDNTLYENPSPASAFTAFPVTGQNTVLSDDFETSLGWSVASTATAGQWNRGTPAGGGDRGDPPTDYDGSGQCYLTGSGDGDTDIDGGGTTLTSPVIDLGGGDARISYARWYSNNYGAAPFEDSMIVSVSNDNGSSWTVVEVVGPTDQASGGWFVHSFWVSEFVTPSSQVRMRFLAQDLGSGSVVEAAVDAFEVVQYTCGGAVPPRIQTVSLPAWTAGAAFSRQLEASGGTGVLEWSDKEGDLAGTGLTLSTDGLLSGTPSAAGTISFTAVVTDESMVSDEQVLTLAVNGPIVVDEVTLPDWTAGVSYARQFTASGGTGSRIFTDKLGQLAGTGLSLSINGLISGNPVSAGVVSFTALVTDAVGATGERVFSLTVNAPVQVTTAALPEGKEGESYGQQLAASGGTGTIVWSEPSNLLAGLGLSLTAGGAVTGTPSDSGTVLLIFRATDQVGSHDEVTLTVHFLPAYICGDVDGNGSIAVSDLTYLVNYLFKNGPPPPIQAAADTDGNGSIAVSDLTRLVGYLFKSGSLGCQ